MKPSPASRKYINRSKPSGLVGFCGRPASAEKFPSACRRSLAVPLCELSVVAKSRCLSFIDRITPFEVQ